MIDRIPGEILDQTVKGLNLTGSTLRDELTSDRPTLLIFLRHFGCIFCREIVADVRQISEQNPHYPRVIFFYQGTVEQGEDFFRRLWPDARAIADQSKTFYDGFEVSRGGMQEMFGAEVWACGVRAAMKGHFIGQKVGDPWTMPTSYLVQGRDTLWYHEGVHAGDHPDFDRIPSLAGFA
jgi:hypothetical protein